MIPQLVQQLGCGTKDNFDAVLSPWARHSGGKWNISKYCSWAGLWASQRKYILGNGRRTPCTLV